MASKNYVKLFSLCAAILLATMLLGGCGSVKIKSEKPYPDQLAPENMECRANLYIQNYGYFLFGVIPITTGDIRRPNQQEYRFCRNSITEKNNIKLLQDYSKRHFKTDKLANVEHDYYSSGMFSLFVVWRRALTTTAVAVGSEKGK